MSKAGLLIFLQLEIEYFIDESMLLKKLMHYPDPEESDDFIYNNNDYYLKLQTFDEPSTCIMMNQNNNNNNNNNDVSVETSVDTSTLYAIPLAKDKLPFWDRWLRACCCFLPQETSKSKPKLLQIPKMRRSKKKNKNFSVNNNNDQEIGTNFTKEDFRILREIYVQWQREHEKEIISDWHTNNEDNPFSFQSRNDRIVEQLRQMVDYYMRELEKKSIVYKELNEQIKIYCRMNGLIDNALLRDSSAITKEMITLIFILLQIIHLKKKKMKRRQFNE
ncbi:hypothetical protein SNEBB_007208 [Seison nebaliae]|nr:hypothetical protein SNEBB_007208 [Seison nebaliae]